MGEVSKNVALERYYTQVIEIEKWEAGRRDVR